MRYLKDFISLKDYDMTPEESREIFNQAEIDSKKQIERYNKVVEIKDQIRYDKLSKKDIDSLLKKAKQLRDKSFVIFLSKISLRFLPGVPIPPKRIKDVVTKQKLEEYLNLDYETYRDLY